jgi:transketolase C-terminal domain/subunit
LRPARRDDGDRKVGRHQKLFEAYQFAIRRARHVSLGGDITVAASYITPIVEAVEKIRAQGVHVDCWRWAPSSPLMRDAIRESVKRIRLVVTVEEYDLGVG